MFLHSGCTRQRIACRYVSPFFFNHLFRQYFTECLSCSERLSFMRTPASYRMKRRLIHSIYERICSLKFLSFCASFFHLLCLLPCPLYLHLHPLGLFHYSFSRPFALNLSCFSLPGCRSLPCRSPLDSLGSPRHSNERGPPHP